MQATCVEGVCFKRVGFETCGGGTYITRRVCIGASVLRIV